MDGQQEVRIEDWSITGETRNCYYPCSPIRYLQGYVFGHPHRKDGTHVTTSRIDTVEGRRVTTRNTTYILGEPDQEFVKWCKEKGCHIPTEDEPIKTIEKKDTDGEVA